jgi:hypothetical protein
MIFRWNIVPYQPKASCLDTDKGRWLVKSLQGAVWGALHNGVDTGIRGVSKRACEIAVEELLKEEQSMVIEITTVEAYKTSDGTIFIDNLDAIKHERRLQVAKVIERFWTRDMTEEEAVDAIITYKESLCAALETPKYTRSEGLK